MNENFVGSLPPAPERLNAALRQLEDPSSPDAGPWRRLPDAKPLDMPVQDFAVPATQRADMDCRDRSGVWVPRAAIFAGALVLTIAFAVELFDLLAVEQMTPLQFVFLVLSTIAFGWIAIGSLSAALGFLPLFVGERPDTLKPAPASTPLSTRTALLFPVYHEDATRIAGTIDAIAAELVASGHAPAFDVFVLSDTRGDEAGAVEAAVYRRLSAALEGVVTTYYRRRKANTGRKAGNIADWVERFGAGYDHFIILDADSIMSGATLVSLAQTMQNEPQSGLIQTVPRLVGGTTLLQRLQAFASNSYGPAVSAGIASWHRDQGNYWGHNAIIRTRAFAEAAGLPELKGPRPFGGHILSHDFVEAVLLQRAGWGVHMLPTIDGSYEGMPPNIVDLTVRDRRWAQGNLQHLAIVTQPGITGMGRMHLGMGAASYLISTVWAASLLVGIVLALQSQQIIPSYFSDSKTLYPIWPVFDPGASLRLFMATMAVVLLPKGLGLLLEWREAADHRDLLGGIRVTFGVIVETIYSMLMAPILMVTQTVATFEIFAGRDAGWSPQSRDDGQLQFTDAMWFARWHTVIGLATAGLAYVVSPGLLIWMLPVVLGLVVAGPLCWWTAQPASRLVSWLLATREDRDPPGIVVSANARRDYWLAAPRAPGDPEMPSLAAA